MPQIEVPKSFFVSERDNLYGDWYAAFWRELISNSLDAGASAIRVRLRGQDGNFFVDFVDNGAGMSREIIENVYMKLGESTKRDNERSVGGFGRARLLTCFSHESYRIRTQDMVVTGDGAKYEIQDGFKPVKGTCVSVGMKSDYSARLIDGMVRVLRQSSLPASFLVDAPKQAEPGFDPMWIPTSNFTPGENQTEGRHVFKFSSWSRKGKKIGEFTDAEGTWGHIHVNEGKTANHNLAVIRVNGIAMYEDYLDVKAQVTVDLEPARARQILTASRDGVRPEFRSEMSKFFQRIAADRKSALRSRDFPPSTEAISAGIGERLSLDSIPGLKRPAGTDAEMAAERMSDRNARITPYAEHQNEATARPNLQTTEGGPGLEETAIPRLGTRLPLAIHIDNPTPGMRQAVKRYRPETWMEEGGIGRNAELLHAAWTGACKYAISRLAEIAHIPRKLEREGFVTGFIFSADFNGMHLSNDTVRNAILLNPVDPDGRQKYKSSSSADMVKMGALALHEVAHTVTSWHDEEYASLLTSMMGATREKDMMAAIDAEMNLTREWQKLREMSADRRAEQDNAPEQRQAEAQEPQRSPHTDRGDDLEREVELERDQGPSPF